MTNFKTKLEELLIAHVDSLTLDEQVAKNLMEYTEEYGDLEGQLISYIDSDMMSLETAQNIISKMESNMRVYKDGTNAQDMSIDGWSRGFEPQQTLDEMRAMGVEITKQQLKTHWDRLDQGFNK